MSEPTLAGLRILVTRAPHQAGKLADRLRQLQAVVLEIPVIALKPPDSWEPLDASLACLRDYHWVIFASANAVEAVLDRLEFLGQRPAALSTLNLAAVGPATRQALSARGLNPTFCPSQFIGEVLVEEFPGYPHLHGLRILWPRTNMGRRYVADKLQEAGAQLDIVPAYKTSLPEDKNRLSQKLREWLASGQLDVITLASAQSALNLASLLSGAGNFQPWLKNVAIACIGPQTAAAAWQALGKVDLQATQHTSDGLVEALQHWHKTRQQTRPCIN